MLQYTSSIKFGVSLVNIKNVFNKRLYNVLAIETSCDDTSVAYLHHDESKNITNVVVNEKRTLDSIAQGGIIPTVAHEHHQSHLASMISDILSRPGIEIPDLLCATRGPGMLGSLSVGLNTTKGLAVGLKRPLLGINHMLGHLLVPRLYDKSIKFPFVSLLVSGGHCILVHSTSVVDHKILCESIDIAAGDSLDKCGREIGLKGIMIGKELEKYTKGIDPNISDTIVDQIKLPNPLSKMNQNKLAFSFAPFITAVKEFIKLHPLESLSQEQHKLLAAKIQAAILNHIITKIKHTIKYHPEQFSDTKTLICSGGVSANQSLRDMLSTELKNQFNSFHYPPLELCTDNAVMIGYSGIELYDHHRDLQGTEISNDLDILPIRKWSLEEIVDVSNWKYKPVNNS